MLLPKLTRKSSYLFVELFRTLKNEWRHLQKGVFVETRLLQKKETLKNVTLHVNSACLFVDIVVVVFCLPTGRSP